MNNKNSSKNPTPLSSLSKLSSGDETSQMTDSSPSDERGSSSSGVFHDDHSPISNNNNDTTTTMRDYQRRGGHQYNSKGVMEKLQAPAQKRLDSLTINKLNFERVGMVGRASEIKEIQQFVPSVRDKKRVLLVGGAAGTGKSLLVQETLRSLFEKPHRDHPCWLLSGKHFQQGDKPYAGMTACCEDLSHQIISAYSSSQLEAFQQQVHTELGVEGVSVLTSVIPGLIPIIGVAEQLRQNVVVEAERPHRLDRNHHTLEVATDASQSSARTMFLRTSAGAGKYLETRLLFNNAFRRFLHVLYRQTSTTIVFIIDDLQWCDEPSFHLMEHILKDREKIGFLIVGTFRPAEVNDEHALTKFRKQLHAAGQVDPHLKLAYVALGNLGRDAVLDMLMELLSATAEKAEPLAECILRKTNGNAFFMVQFLTILQQRKILTFNFGTLTWLWDLEQINHEMEATDNVAHLVRSKMEVLPSHLQGVLPLVGSLGSVFSKDLFNMVMNHIRHKNTNANIAAANHEILDKFVAERLIEAFGTASYRWIHDKVEEAALSLIPADQLGGVQFDLAIYLIGEMNEQQVSQNVFVLVYLLRRSNQILPPNDPQRVVISKLRLESGLQAFRGAAYDQAAVEFQSGIELLSRNNECWQQEYDLCLDLYSAAAEAELCIGQMDAAEEYVSTLLNETKGKPLIHRRRGYNVLIRSYLANGQYEKARDLLLDVLAQLGVKFGSKLTAPFRIINKLLSVKRNVNKNISAIANLPPMSDEVDSWTIFLLGRLILAWYWLQSPLLPLAILTSFERTLEGGIMEISPNIIASVGFMCAVGLQDYQTAKLYALEALDLVKVMTSKFSEAQTCSIAYHLALIHSMPVEDLRKGLLRGYDAGMASGDAEFACWCINNYLEQTLISGAPLESVIELGANHTREAQDLNQQPLVSLLSLTWQAALNLAGHSEDPLVLTGEAMNEEEWLAKNQFGKGIWYLHCTRWKIHLTVLFGAHDMAMDIILKAKVHKGAMDKSIPGAYPVLMVNFHCAIACISMTRKVQKQSAYYRSLAHKFGRIIDTWTNKKNSPNVKHYNSLLMAEFADLKGRTENASEWFQRAITLSARRGFLLDRALAEERFGDFYIRQGDLSSAKYHYNQSILAYRDWGAVAKVKHIMERHSDLFQPSQRQSFPCLIVEINDACAEC